MKKYLLLFALAIFGNLIISCSSSEKSDGASDPNNQKVDLTGIKFTKRVELLPPEAEPSSSSREVSKTSASSAPSDSDYSLDETFTYTQQRIGEALEIINSGFCNYGEDQTLSRTLVNTGAYKAKIDLGYCRKVSGDYNHETLSQGLKDSIIKSTYNNNSLTITTWEADNFGGKTTYYKNTINHPDGYLRLDYIGSVAEYGDSQSFKYYGFAKTYLENGLYYFDYYQPILAYDQYNHQGNESKEIQAIRIVRDTNSGYGKVLGTNSGDNGTFAYNGDYLLKEQGGVTSCYSRSDYYEDVNSYILYDGNYNRISMVSSKGIQYDPMVVSYAHQGNISNSGRDYSNWSDNLTYEAFGKLTGIPCFDNNTGSCVEIEDINEFDDFVIPSGSEVFKLSGGSSDVSIGAKLIVKQHINNRILKKKNTSDCSASGLSLTAAGALDLPQDEFVNPNVGDVPDITEIKVIVGVLQE